MIDLHTHIIYGVDDGARDMAESLALLKQAKDQGITAMIATPHMRYDMFEYPQDVIEGRFAKLEKEASDLGIRLVLGCEYHMNSQVMEDLKSKRVHTLGDTEYVLCEYSHVSRFRDMQNYTARLYSAGYIPIIAHPERYDCIMEDFWRVADLKQMGALIQVNADSVLGIVGRKIKHLSKHLLKHELADILASDVHRVDTRPDNLGEAYKYVSRKYSAAYADKLCNDMPGRVLQMVEH